MMTRCFASAVHVIGCPRTMRFSALCLSLACATSSLAQSPTVTLELTAQDNGCILIPGESFYWSIHATVSAGDNAGLAMISVDLVQEADENPQLVDLSSTAEAPSAMVKFSRPLGICNPGQYPGQATGYGGWQLGTPGAMNLVQIGGAQNTTGLLGTGIAESNEVEVGVGQGLPTQVKTGVIVVPSAPGLYRFSLDTTTSIARVLDPLSPPPPIGDPWPTSPAIVQFGTSVVEFTVGPLILHVDDSVVEPGCGDNWQRARKNLWQALSVAADANGAVAEIWVAEGTYTPCCGPSGTNNPGEERFNSFELVNGVAVYGGFPPGGGDGTFGARDPEGFETILSGDLEADDQSGGDNSENVYHVVSGSGVDATAVLDGFTVRGGHANGPSISYDDEGGGMKNASHASELSNPTVRNCRFIDNNAAYGGAVYNEDGNPTFSDCRFEDNHSTTVGGGMLNLDSSPTLVNCSFMFNSADAGGGFGSYVCENPTLINCLFSGNWADDSGGGMWNAAADSTLVNCTFSLNLAVYGDGGGMHNETFSHPTVVNSIFWANIDSGLAPEEIESAQIHSEPYSEPTVSYSCIQDELAGDGDVPYNGTPYGNDNIDLDPMFVDPGGPSGGNPGEPDGGNLRLEGDSLCIEAGDNSVVTVSVDLDGAPRISNMVVDMGAYEFQGLLLMAHGSRMDHGAAGTFLIESGEVERRSAQGSITVFFEFQEAAYSADGDAFEAGDFTILNGDFVSVTQSGDLRSIEVTCNNVADEACFQIAFIAENAAGIERYFEPTWPILAGDVDGDGLVDTADSNLVNAADGLLVDETNFHCDVDGDGVIEGSSVPPIGDDWAFVDAARGNGLLPCWPVIEGAASRKYHAARYYDVHSGGVEPRTGDLLLVFEFDRTMQSLDNDPLVPADFVVSSGTVTDVTAGWDWSVINVTVAGAADGEPLTLSFDAEDAYGFPAHTEACWRMLVGDVDADGETTTSDTSQVAAQHQAPITSANFRCDVNANGAIEGVAPSTTDYDLADANVGETVESCE